MKDLFGYEPYSPPLPLEKPVHTRARRGDPETSYQAARLMAGKMTAIQQAVMQHLERAGLAGLTDLELEDRCDDHGSTFRTRRAELVEAGYVADSGRRRMLQGRNRIVWIIATLA